MYFVIENGVLARCEVIFLVRGRRLVCWVVGLILFVSVGILHLFYVVVRIVFLRCGVFLLCLGRVLLILVGGFCRLRL